MLPQLDQRGLLPPGIHDCAGWAELAAHFATNERRVVLMQSMKRFVFDELSAVAGGLDFYIAGSYLSDKPAPGDVDCSIVVPMQELVARPGLVALANEGGKGRLWSQYGVEFYVTIDHPQGNDFRRFFQYVGEKTAIAKNLDKLDQRGIAKLISWTTG